MTMSGCCPACCNVPLLIYILVLQYTQRLYHKDLSPAAGEALGFKTCQLTG
jgi:hypothetical protein